MLVMFCTVFCLKFHCLKFLWFLTGRWSALLSMKEGAEEDFASVLKTHPHLGWIYYAGAGKLPQVNL